MREIVHLQAGQCGNQIGAKVNMIFFCREVTISGLKSKIKISTCPPKIIKMADSLDLAIFMEIPAEFPDHEYNANN